MWLMTQIDSERKTAAPTTPPETVADAAQQHHHEAVDRERNAEIVGKDAALQEREQGAREPGEAARDDEARPIASRRRAMPIVSARVWLSRSARSA